MKSFKWKKKQERMGKRWKVLQKESKKMINKWKKRALQGVSNDCAKSRIQDKRLITKNWGCYEIIH